ncbi:MAG: hypothetical protein U1F49_20690 [Rubrivivax sp.]
MPRWLPLLAERAHGGLRHPGIARIVEAGVSNEGTPWIATELAEGQSIGAGAATRPAPARAAHADGARARGRAVCARAARRHAQVHPSQIIVARQACAG